MTRRSLVVCLLFLAACGKPESSVSRKGTPVILISIDTLRSDRLPAYGYDAGSTPAIDELRKDGVLFERAYSHCPLTFPSHTSMLTGVLPADHGVRDNVGYQVADSVRLLPEVLKENGYATGAAVSAFVLRKETKLDRGFDFYDDEVEAIRPSAIIGMVQRDGSETAAASSSWIEKHAANPLFFFFHIYEPHKPWEPPEAFASRFADQYDAEIAYADRIVGDFLANLKRLGIYDEALIILVSDHGEGLNDHGEEQHGIFLYREAIQVPMVVKFPGADNAGSTVRSPAQLIDLFPTVLDETGLPPMDLPGISLRSLVDDDSMEARLVYSETFYPRFHFGWSDLHSLVDGNHQYIQAPRPELYDLIADPGEKRNVLEEERRTYFELSRAIEPFVREAEAPSAVDPEEAAKLAALGYLGTTVQTAPGEILKDPKDTIGTFDQIRIAFTHYRNEEYREALALMDQLLEENSRMADLWDLRSKTLARLGRKVEAIDSAREGLKLLPGGSHLALTVAQLSLEVGNLEDAEAHADLVLSSEPAQAREMLARIALERKDIDRAEREITLALEADPELATAVMTLARVQRDRGNLDEALSTLVEVERLMSKRKNRELSNFHFLRGDVYARMGRGEDAEKEFREEIRLFPNEVQAYKNLIFLLAFDGRTKEAGQMIQDLTTESPTPESYIAICEVLELLGDERSKRFWANRGLALYPGHAVLSRFARS